MSAPRPPALHVPSGTGRDAMAELDRVRWHELDHAYGTGKVGPSLQEDVAGALRAFAARDPETSAGAFDALASNICHQGTIYEATAHAVPFLAAFAAGRDISARQAFHVALLLGSIGVASLFETEDGTRAGSLGEDVAELVRRAFRSCSPLLSSLAAARPALAPLVTSLVRVMEPDDPPAGDVNRLVRLLEQLEESDPPDDDEAPASGGPAERVRHAKFGAGVVLGRDGEKLRIRFDDGQERMLLSRFVVRVDSDG